MASKMRKFFEAKASGDDKKKNKEVGRLLNKKNKEGLDVIKLLLLGECLGKREVKDLERDLHAFLANFDYL